MAPYAAAATPAAATAWTRRCRGSGSPARRSSRPKVRCARAAVAAALTLPACCKMPKSLKDVRIGIGTLGPSSSIPALTNERARFRLADGQLCGRGEYCRRGPVATLQSSASPLAQAVKSST